MMFDNFIIQKISASDHSSAITDKGELYLWGHFGFGESLFPQKIIIKNKIQNVALGNGFGLCFDSNGILYGWGNNNSGELGLGDYEHRTNINQIVTLQNKVIKDFSCGGNFVIALGNTLNKKLEENNINETTTRPAKLPMNLNINEKNNNSLDFFEGSRKVKSHHTRNNNSMGDFREENTLNFKKNIPNISIKYLTNEEIKNRQKASVYDSPNRMTDK